MTEEEKEHAPANENASAGGGLSAKTISKIFKFAAAAGIIVCGVLKWCGVMPEAQVAEICFLWSAVYAIGAGTIDLNIMFDKFSGGKK